MPAKKKKYNARFPPARIKKIMQSDEEVGKVAQVVPIIISKSLEIFVQQLLSASSVVTRNRNARTLTPTHIKAAILNKEEFAFLREVAQQIPDVSSAVEEGGDGDDSGGGQHTPSTTNQTPVDFSMRGLNNRTSTATSSSLGSAAALHPNQAGVLNLSNNSQGQPPSIPPAAPRQRGRPRKRPLEGVPASIAPFVPPSANKRGPRYAGQVVLPPPPSIMVTPPPAHATTLASRPGSSSLEALTSVIASADTLKHRPYLTTTASTVSQPTSTLTSSPSSSSSSRRNNSGHKPHYSNGHGEDDEEEEEDDDDEDDDEDTEEGEEEEADLGVKWRTEDNHATLAPPPLPPQRASVLVPNPIATTKAVQGSSALRHEEDDDYDN